MMAVVWGDPAKGPHAAFHKFKPGFTAPLHTHSSDMHVAVVSGTIITGTEGGPEKKLPPGSYEYRAKKGEHAVGGFSRPLGFAARLTASSPANIGLS
jgi:hypothetical protein